MRNKNVSNVALARWTRGAAERSSALRGARSASKNIGQIRVTCRIRGVFIKVIRAIKRGDIEIKTMGYFALLVPIGPRYALRAHHRGAAAYTVTLNLAVA